MIRSPQRNNENGKIVEQAWLCYAGRGCTSACYLRHFVGMWRIIGSYLVCIALRSHSTSKQLHCSTSPSPSLWPKVVLH